MDMNCLKCLYKLNGIYDNSRPNQADYDAVRADKFKRIWGVISNTIEP